MYHPRVAVVLLALFALPQRAHSQQITRDNYLDFLPPQPRIIAETAASARLHLYGDPADPDHRDINPRDGVDDQRAQRLLLLAEHFSPILRRNTDNVPRAFEDVFDDRLLLHVDTWRDGKRIASAALDLGVPLKDGSIHSGSTALGEEASTPRVRVAPDDARLDSLLRALHPRRVIPNVMAPENAVETVLFFDIPGENVLTWKRIHGRGRPGRSRIYVHPFIHEIAEAADERRYEFVLQYWFYYPYNDGGNNHEGDWEHINVAITTEERGQDPGTRSSDPGRLSEEEIVRILGSDGAIPVDSLRIQYVAYYFHHNVMTVDYLKIASGGTLWSRAESSDGSIHIWEDTEYMDDAVRRRLSLADGRLATHPIGYIGGNNKGTDELLHLRPRFSGSINRDSHGTYPFPGVWRMVGPLDATEKILGKVVPDVRRDRSGRSDSSLPWYELIDDESYVVYRASDMILLPDWERLEPLVMQDAAVRREWAWFLLPVHTGFPAVGSPGAGALKRVNLGNVAPMGPAYNNGWNRPGATDYYHAYHPTVLRVMFAPISPLTGLKSGWGVLNLPIVLWGLLPGGNVAVTQLLPWATGALHVLGAPPGRTFYQGELPDRFTGFGVGRYWQFGGHDFARMLPEQAHPAVRAYLDANAPSGARIGRRRWSPGWGNRMWLNVYYSGQISVENTFGYSEAEISYPVVDSLDRNLAQVSGVLSTRELTGGITYRLPVTSSEVLHPYLRAGYGWTSYSIGTVMLEGAPVPDAARKGGYLLSLWPLRGWWPNTLYGGLGVELFSPTERWLLRRVGYGARIEFTGLVHRLRNEPDCDCHVSTQRGDVALVFLLGW